MTTTDTITPVLPATVEPESGAAVRVQRFVRRIWCGDALKLLSEIPDSSVQTVITDMPYGLTQNKWDSMPDLAAWWKEIRRICTGAVVMTASQPFTSLLVVSNLEGFRHEWIWRKNRGSNFANTVREPFKEHESIVVFAAGKWTYNAQRESRRGSGGERAAYKVAWNPGGSNYREMTPRDPVELTDDRVPSSVQECNTETGLHPTQKPLKLMKYLVATYSNPGDVVLDPYAGSGTTCLAAKELNREWIGNDLMPEYCEIARGRLSQDMLLLETCDNTPNEKLTNRP